MPALNASTGAFNSFGQSLKSHALYFVLEGCRELARGDKHRLRKVRKGKRGPQSQRGLKVSGWEHCPGTGLLQEPPPWVPLRPEGWYL